MSRDGHRSCRASPRQIRRTMARRQPTFRRPLLEPLHGWPRCRIRIVGQGFQALPVSTCYRSELHRDLLPDPSDGLQSLSRVREFLRQEPDHLQSRQGHTSLQRGQGRLRGSMQIVLRDSRTHRAAIDRLGRYREYWYWNPLHRDR